MLQLTLLKLIPFDEDRSTYPSFYFEIFLDPLFSGLCFAVDLKLSLIMLFCSQGFGNVYLNSLWSKFDQFDDLQKWRQESFMISSVLALALVGLTIAIVLGLLIHIADLNTKLNNGTKERE